MKKQNLLAFIAFFLVILVGYFFSRHLLYDSRGLLELTEIQPDVLDEILISEMVQDPEEERLYLDVDESELNQLVGVIEKTNVVGTLKNTELNSIPWDYVILLREKESMEHEMTIRIARNDSYEQDIIYVDGKHELLTTDFHFVEGEKLYDTIVEVSETATVFGN